MKKIAQFLWEVLVSIMVISLAVVVGLYLSIKIRQQIRRQVAQEVGIDAEREFMRPEWLNDNFQTHYDDVEILINDERLETGGMCYINPLGEVYINWEVEERWTALAAGKDCMAHEVGHWIDRKNGFPSETEEFREAIDLAARMDFQIANFSCICGKSCEDGEWGGYGEIYADLFERQSIGEIPAVLWDWYLPYYPMKGE